jgi:hypothetical protein
MVRRTFDGGTLHTQRGSDTADTPVGAPLMTFTLIDGDTDDDQELESEVRAAFGTARSAGASGASTQGATDVGSHSSVSALRRILGNSDDTPVRPAHPTSGSVGASRLIDQNTEAPSLDESGSLLRPHPSVDRLDNDYTMVSPAVRPNNAAGRGFLRRRR